MQSSRLLTYGAGALIACGVIWYKYSQKGDIERDCREQILTHMHNMPDFAGNEPLYTELLDHHHEMAFDHHYTIGGRRSSSKFDSEGYLDELFGSMADEAQRRQQTKAAEHLRELRTHITFEDE